MAIDIDHFHTEFFQEVHSLADAEGAFAEDSFFDVFCEHLMDAGELDEANRVQYLAPTRGIRIDGWRRPRR